MKKITVVAAALLAVVLLAGCAQLFQRDDTPERYAAYYGKCQEYATLYGSPRASAVNPSYEVGSGLCIVRLLDFDGNGSEELLLGYIDPKNIVAQNFSLGLEVWAFADGKAILEGEVPVSLHGTNGFQPYVEAVKTAEGGSVLFVERCYGSGPPSFAFDVFGYGDNGFGALAGRAFQGGYDGGTSYYVCSNGTGSHWMDGKWIPATQEEYEAAFAPYSGEVLLHAHLFHYSTGDFDEDGGDSLEDTLNETREVISQLADGVKK